MKAGDYAKVVGLEHFPELNGRHVEILGEVEDLELPEPTGRMVKAPRHPVRFITEPHRTGYIAPDCLVETGPLTAAIHRAIWIHETGSEPPKIRTT